MTDLHEVPTRRARVGRLMATERFRWWLAFFVLEMLVAVRAGTPSERDPYWSARAGTENLAGTPLIRPDTWSWSKEGDWYPNSPVWNVLLGLGWQGLGFWGLFWVAFLAMSLIVGLALIIARLAGGRALPTLIAFLAVLLLASSGLSPRATVIVQCMMLGAVLFAWWWGGIAGRLHIGVASGVVALSGFGLSAVGNWVHLSFMLMSAAIAVLWAVAWWASPGMGNIRRLVLVAAGTTGLFLGCVLSPYGIALTLERLRVVDAVCRGLIAEWMSVFATALAGDLRLIPIAVPAVVVALGSAFWVYLVVRRNRRFDPRTRLVLPLVIFGVPAIIVGLDIARFLLIGLLALLPVAGAAATSLVDRVRRRQRLALGFWSRPKIVEYTSGRFWTVVIAGIAIVLSPIAAVAIGRGARPPEAAVIEMLPQGCHVWAEAAAAGPIILMRPDAKVWIDGRVDFYGRERILEYRRIVSGQDAIPRDADCLVVPARFEDAGLQNLLDDNNEWSRTAELDGYSLWVRA